MSFQPTERFIKCRSLTVLIWGLGQAYLYRFDRKNSSINFSSLKETRDIVNQLIIPKTYYTPFELKPQGNS